MAGGGSKIDGDPAAASIHAALALHQAGAVDEARANVRTELSALDAIAVPAFDARPELAARKADLADVNRALWDIEDALRDKEAQQAFDAEFIALARAVYHRNDERARIKRAINDLLGSAIVEEKSYQSYDQGPATDGAGPVASTEDPHG